MIPATAGKLVAPEAVPTNTPVRSTGLLGSKPGSMNSPARSVGNLPAAAWYKAIRLWVLPPPRFVSSRMTLAPSGLPPLSRPRASFIRVRRPPEGKVPAKNVPASWYVSGAVPAATSSRLAANFASVRSPDRTSSRGVTRSNRLSMVRLSH